jgi:hypothetical protein
MMQENERLKKRVAELENQEPKMELRELRRMKPVVEAVKRWMSDDRGKTLDVIAEAYSEYKSESENHE